MLKQVYRFLSIMLISNLLFSPAVLSKPQNNADKTSACAACQAKHKKSLLQKLFGCKKTEEQKPVIQKPDYNNSHYVTKYGVFYPEDINSTYPPQQPNGKN